jgi:hypothetical protein
LILLKEGLKKKFLFSCLVFGVTIFFGIALNRCSSSSGGDVFIPQQCFSTPISPPLAPQGSDVEGFRRFTSGIQLPNSGFVTHVHDLYIENSLFQSVPSECLSFYTSTVLDHFHQVDITVDRFDAIINGGGTTVETLIVRDHSHAIPIALTR